MKHLYQLLLLCASLSVTAQQSVSVGLNVAPLVGGGVNALVEVPFAQHFSAVLGGGLEVPALRLNSGRNDFGIRRFRFLPELRYYVPSADLAEDGIYFFVGVYGKHVEIDRRPIGGEWGDRRIKQTVGMLAGAKFFVDERFYVEINGGLGGAVRQANGPVDLLLVRFNSRLDARLGLVAGLAF